MMYLNTWIYNGRPTGQFYRIETETIDIPQDEKVEYLLYKQIKLLSSIKGYLLFFVVLTIIGLIAGFITLHGMN